MIMRERVNVIMRVRVRVRVGVRARVGVRVRVTSVACVHGELEQVCRVDVAHQVPRRLSSRQVVVQLRGRRARGG